MGTKLQKGGDWREIRRLRAIELKKRQWKQKEIAEALGVTPGAISQWIRASEDSGLDALRSRSKSGAPARLSEKQLARIPKLLSYGAEAYGYRGELWTYPRVAYVIEQEFGVRGDASANYYEENRYPNNNIYIVLKVKITNPSERLRQLNLVGWAHDLLAGGDTASFLRRCGDSFIAGRTTGGEFSAVIKIDTTSKENKRTVQTRLAASGITWNASAAVADILQSISQTNRIEVRMFKRGGVGALPDHTHIAEIFEFARNLPATVQANAAPSVYLISSMDYDTVANLPRENASLLAQRRVLERIANNRDTAFERWGNADFVLRNSAQFEDFNSHAVAHYRRQLDEIIANLVVAALDCEAHTSPV